jgi:hypothetical protein
LENFISITDDGIFTKKIPTVKIPSPYGSYGEGFIEIRSLVIEIKIDKLFYFNR